MSDSDHYGEPPARVNILPGYVNIGDAVCLVRAAVARHDKSKHAESVKDLKPTPPGVSLLGPEWNAAWHLLRQCLLEGSITAFELGPAGRLITLAPSFWADLFSAPVNAKNDPFGLNRRDRIEPSPFRDWKSPTGFGRYAIDLQELQSFLAIEFASETDNRKAPLKKGRKVEIDSVAIMCQAAHIMFNRMDVEPPTKSEQLIEQLMDWYYKTYRRHVGRSTIQPWVSQFWRHLGFDNPPKR